LLYKTQGQNDIAHSITSVTWFLHHTEIHN
jgi:hypothetical protein